MNARGDANEDRGPASASNEQHSSDSRSLRVHLVPAFDEPTMIVLRHALGPNVTLTPGPVPGGRQADPPPREPFDGTAGLSAQELQDLSQCDILVSGRPSREHLQQAQKLRALIIPWAGLPTSTRDLLLEFPHLSIHNLHDNAAPTAEMALTLMLAAAKRIIPNDSALRQGDWRPRYAPEDPSIMLEGKTVVVLGFGAIGRRVARMCQGLGMQVVGVRRSSAAPDPQETEVGHPATFAHHPEVPGAEIVTRDALHEVLQRAHALVISVPLTPETEGMIGEHELGLLQPQSVIVNIGRGPIVDQHALYAALTDARHPLAAAGLDVWYNYPADEAARAKTFPAEVPLHELDQVVMSPHRAAIVHSAEARKRRMLALADLLNTAASGRPLPNRVDLEAGY
ncbi:MAG: 2-hydroxyacid dehydrogenase [Planctomycetota bacterium]